MIINQQCICYLLKETEKLSVTASNKILLFFLKKRRKYLNFASCRHLIFFYYQKMLLIFDYWNVLSQQSNFELYLFLHSVSPR